MAERRVDIILAARNQASAEVRKLNKELKELGHSGKGGGATSGLGSALASITKFAGPAAIAMGTFKAAVEAFDAGRAAAGSIRLATAFDNLAGSAGQSSSAMLDAMRKAAKGTINDTELIQSANRAMLLGVADSAGEMAKLLEVAGARAKAMGISTSQAFGDIVTGIGRMSPLILDNLGIVVDAEQANERYAQSLGKSATALTETERKQALVNEVIRTSAGLLADNAKQGRDLAGEFERMDASISNAQGALGALFSPAAAVVASKLADAADGVAVSLIAVADGTSAARNQLALSDTEYKAAIDRLSDLQRALDTLRTAGPAYLPPDLQAQGLTTEADLQRAIQLQQEQIRLADTARSAALAVVQLKSGVIEAFGPMSDLSGAAARLAVETKIAADAERDASTATDELANKQAALRGEILATVGALGGLKASLDTQLRSSFLAIADTVGGSEALASYRKASGQLDIQIGLMDKLGLSTEAMEFAIQPWIEGIRGANSELENTRTATAKIAPAVSEAQRAFDTLKSKIQSVIGGSLSSGIDIEGLFGRQDAIEEDARRLADVAVKGFASPWAGYFKQKFPDLFKELTAGGDIRAAATNILRDFEAGLRPELLNRELIKDRVRRMVLGEESLSGLAASIAQELTAELGGAFNQADILAKAQQAVSGTGGALAANITPQLSIAPGAASNVVGQLGAQSADDKVIERIKAIGAAMADQLFSGLTGRFEELPFWDKILAIIIRQRIAQGT